MIIDEYIQKIRLKSTLNFHCDEWKKERFSTEKRRFRRIEVMSNHSELRYVVTLLILWEKIGIRCEVWSFFSTNYFNFRHLDCRGWPFWGILNVYILASDEFRRHSDMAYAPGPTNLDCNRILCVDEEDFVRFRNNKSTI